ncbi:RNA polymerase sigma factor RpoD/SigA [Staphylococcus delphini]|uniref:sigma-70 family RNA polymerase sigma factor n=1 Tax=Staphylococcus delphini TaxID=53344 RepID=UPI000309AE46|nr:sigma-70 family RNA polymerase sigma factor [Staphylococcus delphini]
MGENITSIIDYINSNIKYGSEIKGYEVDLLLKKFSVKKSEKYKILEELKSLKVTILEDNYSHKYKLVKLYSLFNKNKELLESDLLKWFEDEFIEIKKRENICKLLNDLGYKVIKDRDLKSMDKVDELFEDEDFEDLDELLESDSFKKDVKSYKKIIDKEYNIEYLTEFEKTEEGSEEKLEILSNIVTANKKLVSKIVYNYKLFSTVSYTEEDMYQSGMMGLLKAAQKFDVKRGYQFSTYATWWIRQSIMRGIADFSTTIRVPVYMREKLIKLIRIENELLNKYGRVATNEQISKELKCELDEVETMKKYIELSNLKSLETSINDDESSFLIDLIPDEKSLRVEDQVYKLSLRQELMDVINKRLTDKERTVILMRFGFKNREVYTLEEIGKKLNVTRERIRQIESKALEKLKVNRITTRLGDYYYD